jgi:hypothetical protein
MVKKFLDSTELKGCPAGEGCAKGDSPIQYEQMINHLMKECQGIQVACPSQCGVSFSRAAWEKHFDSECDKIELSCDRCDTKFKKSEMGIHDCVTVLRDEVKKQKEERDCQKKRGDLLAEELEEKKEIIAKLKVEVERLKMEMLEILHSKQRKQSEVEEPAPEQKRRGMFSKIISGVKSSISQSQ